MCVWCEYHFFIGTLFGLANSEVLRVMLEIFAADIWNIAIIFLDRSFAELIVLINVELRSLLDMSIAHNSLVGSIYQCVFEFFHSLIQFVSVLHYKADHRTLLCQFLILDWTTSADASY